MPSRRRISSPATRIKRQHSTMPTATDGSRLKVPGTHLSTIPSANDGTCLKASSPQVHPKTSDSSSSSPGSEGAREITQISSHSISTIPKAMAYAEGPQQLLHTTAILSLDLCLKVPGSRQCRTPRTHCLKVPGSHTDPIIEPSLEYASRGFLLAEYHFLTTPKAMV